MKSNYNDCLTRLLKDEGGYTNDPSDSGGPTNYGITLKDVKLYVNKNANAADVMNLSLDTAKSIYKSKYWDALNCDSLSGGVDYTVFDYGVNSGLGRPRKALQRFKGKVGVDLIDAINDERVSFLKALEASQPKDQKFDGGWMARVKRVRNYSKYLAAHTKDNTTGPAGGIATVGIGAWLSQYWHSHETAIIIGAILVAICVGTAIHMYKNKGKI